MIDVRGTIQRMAEALRGCRGLLAMDYDGLPLEVVRPGSGGADLDAIGAEMAAILRDARQAAEELGLDPLKGVTIRAEGGTLLFRDCGRDYLLLAVIDSASSAVVARRALAEAARGIAAAG